MVVLSVRWTCGYKCQVEWWLQVSSVMVVSNQVEWWLKVCGGEVVKSAVKCVRWK